ncbi:121_t:CDS:2, partial [Gigaspora rosea]
DFNTIANDKVNPELGKGKKIEKSLPSVKWFERQDYIWVTENLAMRLKEARVKNIATYTGSDHNSPLAEIKLEYLISNYSKAVAKKKAGSEIEEALDLIWKTIERNILKTAMKHIPKKKICNTKSSKINRKSLELDKIMVELSRWIKYAKKKGNEVTKEEKGDFEKFKENIKKKYQVELENIDKKHIIGKEQEIALTEHWVQESQNVTTETIVKRYEGCNHNRLEKLQSCEEQIERS